MFGRVYRRCSKWSKRGRNKRMDTSQSRELAILPLDMSSNPTEFGGKDKTYSNTQYLPSLQSMASPATTTVTYQESIFKNSRQDPPRPFPSNTEQYIVVKTMKRQREAYKQSMSDSEATMSEASEAPKRRKTASENLALPDLTGTTVSAPHTPPGDVTPKLQASSSTFEPPTPDASFDLRHRRQTSRLSQVTSSSTSFARINQIDLFKVVMRDQNPLYYQPDQHPSVDQETRAQDYVGLAHAHKKVLDFHGAETDFLRAFQIYNRAKGPESPEVLRTMGSLAEIYEDQSRPSEAPRRRRNCYVFCG